MAEPTLKIFLERKDDDPNAPGDNGRTGLHAAVQWNQHYIVEMLLKSGRLGKIVRVGPLFPLLPVWTMCSPLMGIDIATKDNDHQSAYEMAVDCCWE